MSKTYNFLKILLVFLLGSNMNSLAQISTFNYTGSLQQYTVPAGVTTINISASGAAGGGMTNYGMPGGNGANMSGNFAVTPGQVLSILVGGQGQTAIYEGGGGGGTFVWDSTTTTLMLAAGGGGGAGQDDNNSMGIAGLDATTATDGVNGYTMPNGGGTAGNGGTIPTGGVYDYAAGGTGWLSNGNDGTSFGCTFNCTGGGTPLTGGTGGSHGGDLTYDGSGGYGGGGGGNGRCGAVGGGGGGGYSGGGAGGELNSLVGTYTPGGGGGSYNGGTVQTNSVGNSGDGIVTIAPICFGSSPITGPTNVCVGQTINLSDTASGGTWSSSNTALASVGTTGDVAGISDGVVNIFYTTPLGCVSFATVTVNPLPSAITAPKNICLGDSVMFTDGGGGTWSSANTDVSVDAATGAVTGLSLGSAIITYTLPTGCSTVSSPTAINPLPTAILGGTSVCVGSTITLSDTTAGGSWYSGGSSNATVNPGTGEVSGVSAGTATITYTAAGCNITTIATINPLPTIDTVTGGGRYCLNGSGEPVGLSSSDTGFTYVLFLGSSPIDTLAGTDTALNFGKQKATGSYGVVATNNMTGCSAQMWNRVRIGTHSLPHVHTVSGGGTMCAGDAGFDVVLDSSWHGNYYKLYDNTTFVDSVLGTDTAIHFGLQTSGGNYTVVAVSTRTGCIDTMRDTAIITVIPLATPLVSISSDHGDTVCDGSLITFTANPTFGGPTPFYQWNVNGTDVGTNSPTFSYVPKNTDAVAVLMISDTRCVIKPPVALNEVTMTVDSVYIPAVTITASPGLSVSKSQSVTLTAVATAAGPAPTYQWYRNGIFIPGATNANYTGVFLNNDSVTCKVTGSNKCGMESFNSVILQVSSTGISQLSATGNDVFVVPNPNKGSFVVKGSLGTSADEEVSMEITNMLGQVVYKTKVSTQGGNINEQVQLSNNLASGMYLLNINSATTNRVLHIVIEQ